MKILFKKRCYIGEGPIWNKKEKRLYYTNGGGNELCIYDPEKDVLTVRPLPFSVSAYAFTKSNELIISHAGGVDILNSDDSLTPLYDKRLYDIKYCNDMKVGPDGRIYVGTQSGKRFGVSDKIDGRLYSIDKNGNVRTLLDGLILSNGMEWSLDEKRLYHTDSDTNVIREYTFDKVSGDVEYTGRNITVLGVDGFTIGSNGYLYVACWGKGHIAVIDTRSLSIVGHIKLPAHIPSSCSFFGSDMNMLAITTADYESDLSKDENAGFTLLMKADTTGRLPYLFG